MSHSGDGFRIEWRWKEQLIYWEDDQGFLFEAGWGVDPPTLYVPVPAVWDLVTPPWLHGRREEVVARLVAHGGHVLEDDHGEKAEPQWSWILPGATRPAGETW